MLRFAFQGVRGLWEPDEGRYTNIAIQMLRSGDFVVPAFNDDVPHFAKPPLTYWAVAAGLIVAGRHEWVAASPRRARLCRHRLRGFPPWQTLRAAAAVAARARLRDLPPALLRHQRRHHRHAADAVGNVRRARLRGMGRERRDGPRWRPPLFLMWLSFALAFLTKGPAGLLPLVAFAAFAALAGGWHAVARLFCIGGVTVFAVVGLGWYAFVAATNPGLINYFVRDEFARRIASG